MRRVGFLLLLLAGCASDPEMRGDHDAAQYSADLASCRSKASTDADKEVKRRFYSFVLYGITYPLQQRQDTRTCLSTRGYAAPG